MSKRLALLIDQERCIGCWTCAVVCKMENDVALGNWWNRILSNGEGEYGEEPNIGLDGQPDLIFQPTACMHCLNAPCVKACPTGATYKREDGITAQNYKLCVGCRACMAACPYNARVFNWQKPHVVPDLGDDHVGDARVPSRPKGVVEKCTFCQEKVDAGEQPACVYSCPSHARIFGDINDPNTEISKKMREYGHHTLLEELGTQPSVFYSGQRRKLNVSFKENGGDINGD